MHVNILGKENTAVSKTKYLPSWSLHSGNFCCPYFKKVSESSAIHRVAEVATRPKATGFLIPRKATFSRCH